MVGSSTRNLPLCFFLFITTALIFVRPASTAFNLTILHTNDVHCRFEEADKYGGTCTADDAEKGKCFGGYARLVHQAREIRRQHPNTIFLNGGDFFQGTM